MVVAILLLVSACLWLMSAWLGPRHLMLNLASALLAGIAAAAALVLQHRVLDLVHAVDTIVEVLVFLAVLLLAP